MKKKSVTTIVKEIVDQLTTNLKEEDTYLPYSFYVNTEEVSVYFKCNAVFSYGAESHRALIISNIDISYTHRSRGIFKTLIASLPRRYPYLVVECVHNPRLRKFLLKENWTVKEDITFFKKL